MTKPMHAHSRLVVEQFCALCDKAHEYWLNHLELFDKNPRNDELMKSTARNEWIRLSIISHEYSLLQVRKLHDRAVTSGKITLGIDYMLTYGGWSESVRSCLTELAEELDGLADKLEDVRNKILSHNDLATIVTGATLGEFDKGADEKYFEALQEFVNIVHDQVAGGPYPFNSQVRNDIAFFLRTIKPLSIKKQSDGLTSPPTPRA
jgi:AbiU2